MQEIINLLLKHNELKVIKEELDIELEIPHIAYIEVKKEDSKALLFTNPICKRSGKKFDIPVLMNIFGSFKRLSLLAPDVNEIANEIESFLKLSMPKNFIEKIFKLKQLSTIRYTIPKTTNKALWKDNIYLGDDVDLFSLPILKTWENDGGAFITMGQIYTCSLDGNIKNLGMYRLQVYDKNHLGLHWQIHKDSTHFFNEYKKANKKMPIAIGIGGDPLYTWCGQAPLPYGMYELALFGLIRKRNPKVCKCNTNDLMVPYDCDIVIEGFVDPNIFKNEGPFGDHTGFYTPIELYPVLEVSAISYKNNPIYLATVVGKPPLEDKYMGYMTERVFLPLLKTTNPFLIDYYMPENGVFHNLILAKIDTKYPNHAKQIMHSFWGIGQMSFVKHAIFVPKDSPELDDHFKISEYILNHLDIDDLVISKGVCDALDHSSPEYASGGKLGIDCTMEVESKYKIEILDDNKLLSMIKNKYDEVIDLKQYFVHTKNPITIISIDKQSRVLDHIDAFDNKHCKIVFVIDNKDNDLNNLYMCIWRITNNIDAMRDILIQDGIALIDATAKGILENHNRDWPDDVSCTRSVIDHLCSIGVIERDEELWKKYQIF